MKNSRIRTVIISVITVLLLLTVMIYLALAYYYQGGFSLGTYVNGIYCTGKSVEEINQLLISDYQHQVVTVIEQDGTEELDLSQVDCTVDYSDGLHRILDSQNSFLWIGNLFSYGHYRITPVVAYDPSRLDKEIRQLACIQNSLPETDYELAIRHTEQGYVLIDNTGNRLDKELAVSVLRDRITHGETEIHLSEEDCYYDLAVTPQMQEVYSLWALVQEFQSFRMTYLFGTDRELIDASVVSGWITLLEDGSFFLNEEGQLTLNEDAVAAYVDLLAEKYDTYNVQRCYTTVKGLTVTVDGGIYGNELNRKVETAYLLQAFREKNTQDREPEYLHKALFQGMDDIGPDFIEVDLTAQKLYFVLNHEIVLETDVVSGNKARHSTPSRACYVQGKYRKRILRGPGYASFVYYWVPVYKNIGIHDATWRSSFGGDIYLKNGSHGCINIPLENMEIMFDQIVEGMPVLMYYETE